MTPPAWPQPHPYAQDFDTFWLVRQLPPAPWPELPPGPVDHQVYGPEGTEWLFPVSDYLNRLTTGGFSQGFSKALGVLLSEAKAVAVPDSTTWGWRTPASAPEIPPSPEVRPMRWIHATIVAKLGALEEINHTLNFRTNPADADQSPASLLTFANQIRDTWTSFFQGFDLLAQNHKKISDHFQAGLVYKEVRTAYLEQTAAATTTTVPGKRGPRKVFHYPRPVYLVPTQYSQFAPGAVHGTDPSGIPPLPYEVAAVLTHTTGLRGPRNRGRIYLGGLASTVMGADGMFDATVKDMGAAYGQNFVNALNTASGNRLHIVSRAYNTSVGVNGVAVGLVPDSQRRRRRSQLEASTQQWQSAG